MKLAGVDGYRDGWVVASRTGQGAITIGVAKHIGEVLEADYDFIALDIPIGLADRERPCDAAAKKFLGSRSCCVFHAPIRPSVKAEYDDAKAICRGLGVRAPSVQTWGIVPKILQVDAVVSPGDQARLFEVHPEVCFCAMNGGAPLFVGKDKPEGRQARRELLHRHIGVDPISFTAKGVRPKRAKVDDIYDALAALWSASRIAAGAGRGLSPAPAYDARGLRMEIWY